jgi:hypothetical protein
LKGIVLNLLERDFRLSIRRLAAQERVEAATEPFLLHVRSSVNE